MKQRNHGITIFESLVVVACILFIVGIILPAFTKFREAGKKAQCLSNLHQYGIALKLYETDFLFMPKYGNNPYGAYADVKWDDLLDKTGYIRISEDVALKCQTYLRDHQDYSNIQRTYAVPRAVFSSAGWTPIYIQSTDIEDQYNTILLAEVKRTGGGNEYEYCEPTGTSNADTDRHTGGANYLFFDGHVSWHKSGESSLKWTR